MVKNIVGFSGLFFLLAIADQVIFRSNQVILGIVSGTAAVAVYAIGAQIYISYMPLATAISGVFFPKITQMVAMKRPTEELSALFIRIGRLQFLFVGLVLSGFIIFGQRFIHFWVGDAFSDAYWVALLVIFPCTFDIIQNLGSTIMQAKNDFSFRTLVGWGTALLNIGLAVPVSSYFGGIGCALITGGLIFLGNCLVMDIYYMRKLKLESLTFWENIASISLYILLTMLISQISSNLIHQMGLLPLRELIAEIISYIVFYMIIIGKLALNSYECDLLKNGFKKLSFKLK